jgi:hypothetical protein
VTQFLNEWSKHNITADVEVIPIQKVNEAIRAIVGKGETLTL